MQKFKIVCKDCGRELEHTFIPSAKVEKCDCQNKEIVYLEDVDLATVANISRRNDDENLRQKALELYFDRIKEDNYEKRT